MNPKIVLIRILENKKMDDGMYYKLFLQYSDLSSGNTGYVPQDTVKDYIERYNPTVEDHTNFNFNLMSKCLIF